VYEVSVSQQLVRRDRHFLHACHNPEPAYAAQAPAHFGANLRFDPIPIDGHEKDWVRACKGGKPASSNFDYSGPLTEMVLLGNLAVRFPEQRLLWDGPNLKVTNDDEADGYVRRKYREGWSL